MTQAVQIKSAQAAKPGSKKLKTGKELPNGASAKGRFSETRLKESRLFEKFLARAGQAEGVQRTGVSRGGAKASRLKEEAASDPKAGTAKKEESRLSKEKLPAANPEKERRGKKTHGEEADAVLSSLSMRSPVLQTPETKKAEGGPDLQVKGAGQKGTAAAGEKLSAFAAKAAAKEDGGTDKPQRMIQVLTSAPQTEAGQSAKRTDKKEEAKKATVIDLRKPQAKEQGDANAAGSQPQRLEAEASGEKAKTEGDGLSFDLLKSQSGKTAEAAAKQGDKQTSFASTLDEVLKNQIVKQTGIILKNETAGEIRLTLKPEHLGKVRIRIELEDKHVAGKIFVENETVRNIFEQNMNELSKAFAEGGFQLGSLDVSVGEKRRGDGNPANKGQGNALRAIASLEEHVQRVSDSFAVPGLSDDRIVNLFV